MDRWFTASTLCGLETRQKQLKNLFIDNAALVAHREEINKEKVHGTTED